MWITRNINFYLGNPEINHIDGAVCPTFILSSQYFFTRIYAHFRIRVHARGKLLSLQWNDYFASLRPLRAEEIL